HPESPGKPHPGAGQAPATARRVPGCVLTARQEFTVKLPTKSLRLGGRAAAIFITPALLFAGCSGSEGAGTVNMTAVKAAAASRGLPDASKRAPVVANPVKPRRGGSPIKPERGGH